MSSILHKKQQFKKQLEDSFKEHQDLVKYTKNVLLLNRPIDFGVLFTLISIILYYFRNYNPSALSFFSFFLSSILILHTIIINFNFKTITRFIPNQNPKESYDDIINLIIKIKFSFSDSVSELKRLRHVNPTKFNIQTSIVLCVLGTIGIFLSGYTIIVLMVYSLLLLPYILYGKKPQNTGQTTQEILNNIIIIMTPIIENLIKLSKQLYEYLLDLATNKKQPTPGVPNPNYVNNNNNNNNNSNSNNNISNNINNTLNEFQQQQQQQQQQQDNISNISNNLNNTINQVGSRLSQQLPPQQFAQPLEEEYNDYSDESSFTKNIKSGNPSNPILKKRF